MEKNLYGPLKLLISPINSSQMMEKYSKWENCHVMILKIKVENFGLKKLFKILNLIKPIILQLMIMEVLVIKIVSVLIRILVKY